MSDHHKLTFDLKVTPSFNAEDQVLQFETSSHAQVISREVIRLKEETTRKALIALGWRPPEPCEPQPLISRQRFRDLQKLIFELERNLKPQSTAASQLGDAREYIGLALRSFEFEADQ